MPGAVSTNRRISHDLVAGRDSIQLFFLVGIGHRWTRCALMFIGWQHDERAAELDFECERLPDEFFHRSTEEIMTAGGSSKVLSPGAAKKMNISQATAPRGKSRLRHP